MRKPSPTGWAMAAVCLGVLGLYFWTAGPGLRPGGQHYNRLVDGFRSGHLYLNQNVPAGLAGLSDPYDPAANLPFRGAAYDMSFYRGKFYLYFGITPAVLVFWPWLGLTGHYLSQSIAIALFCSVGFLAGAGLLRAAARKYYAQSPAWLLLGGTAALGLCSGVRVLLQRPNVWEVPISCGYALSFLALAALWGAFHDARREARWLCAASVLYGLAVGARPTLVLGAGILLLPAARAILDCRRAVRAPGSASPFALLAAGVAPLTCIGGGLMLYNYARFGSPWEFGAHYQLLSVRQDQGRSLFSLRFVWYNFRVYLLQPIHWHGRFPFAGAILPPAPVPSGHAAMLEGAYGILTNLPITGLALAAPLAVRGEGRSSLRWFTAAVALFCGACLLPLLTFFGSLGRYEVDFLPAFLWLALLAACGLEEALGQVPAWRLPFRRVGVSLLCLSIVQPGLSYLARRQMQRDNLAGADLLRSGRFAEAIGPLEAALRVEPDLAYTHVNLGTALAALGRNSEAIAQLQWALRIEPDLLGTRRDLAKLKAGQAVQPARAGP